MNFIWLHDISDAQVQSYTKYYGIGQRGFAEYLGTLGLRYHDGKDKQAFETLRQKPNHAAGEHFAGDSGLHTT